MLTLPSDLTPHQWRLIDAAVHEKLHPADNVAWQWGFTGSGGFARITEFEAELCERGYNGDYRKEPCVDSKPIPAYALPGPANNELAEAMMPYREEPIYLEIRNIGLGVYQIESRHGEGRGKGIAHAILAAYMDWKSIPIPDAEKKP